MSLPRHRFDIEHSEVPQPTVRGQPGHLDRAITEIAVPQVGAMQMPMHDARRLDSVHDALQALPVRGVTGQVLGSPVGWRPPERMRDTGRAVMTG